MAGATFACRMAMLLLSIRGIKIAPMMAPVTQPPAIQQVQNAAESARMVHHLIEALPTSQEEMGVIERRSQLMITKANVTRMAISDQGILDVVQYSPRELSLIGLGRGSTTLTLMA